jgi:hypothetical protein
MLKIDQDYNVETGDTRERLPAYFENAGSQKTINF